MPKKRIPEPKQDISELVEKLFIENYNQLQRNMRDNGWLHTDAILNSGIISGNVLEIGSGPGFTGLEILKKERNINLTGLEISKQMIQQAMENSKEYNVSERLRYVQGDAHNLPFDENQFDSLITLSSLHEWENPLKIFDEIFRVLKKGGKYYIRDLRRDISFGMKLFMKLMIKPRIEVPGFIRSLNASYTIAEVKEMINQTKLVDSEIAKLPTGFTITGIK